MDMFFLILVVRFLDTPTGDYPILFEHVWMHSEQPSHVRSQNWCWHPWGCFCGGAVASINSMDLYTHLNLNWCFLPVGWCMFCIVMLHLSCWNHRILNPCTYWSTCWWMLWLLNPHLKLSLEFNSCIGVCRLRGFCFASAANSADAWYIQEVVMYGWPVPS